jgi:hypothetical protein
LPEAAKADHLIDALRRHGVLSTGRVRDVTTDAPHGAFISCARNRHGMAKTAVLKAGIVKPLDASKPMNSRSGASGGGSAQH